jgi:hypothetical protein
LLQTAVRDAAEGRLSIKTDDAATARLQADLERAHRRRDTALAAGVLWLSGLTWLALANRHQAFGWVQVAAAIALVVRYRSLRLQVV